MSEQRIYAIGAMNVDKKLYLLDDYFEESSNPVRSSQSVGGVIRNVAENLGRLGHPVQLFSVYGEDPEAQFIRENSEAFLDLSEVDCLKGFSTSQYIAVLDKKGDLKTAFACMEICKCMDVSWLEEKLRTIPEGAYVVADLNLAQESLDFLLKHAVKKSFFLVFVPVSASKMKNLPQQLKGLSLLIVNKLESETFFKQKIHTQEDLEKIAQLWIGLGVERVVITQGSKGVLYTDAKETHFVEPKVLEHFVDATGAGDAFSATLVALLSRGASVAFALECAMTNAFYTIQSEETVRHNLSFQNLMKEREKLYEQ